jgi:hypothetical protein
MTTDSLSSRDIGLINASIRTTIEHLSERIAALDAVSEAMLAEILSGNYRENIEIVRQDIIDLKRIYSVLAGTPYVKH